jgi:Tol biopolymer transport system component
MPITPGAKLVPVLATEFAESNADVSPDGRWMVYQSNEAGGTVEVFVRPYPNVHSGRWAITSGGGLQPMWTSAGAEILYVAADGKLMSVAVNTRAGFSTGPATVAVTAPFYTGNLPRTYDATPDGKQILIIEDVPGTRSSIDSITVVLNWGNELRRLVAR